MKKLIHSSLQALVIFLLITGCGLKKPAQIEESFLGKWHAVKGNVEAYSFLKDNNSFIFTGTQAMDPVVYGTWKVDKDKFTITLDNGISTTYIYSLSDDTLVFNNGQEIYTRTTPLDMQFPEVRILKDLASDLAMDFSKPQQAEINWNVRDDSANLSGNFLVKGFSVALRTTQSSGDILKITGYLSDSGFEPDSVNATESYSGFRDDKQLIIVSSYRLAENKNDSILVKISSGIIK
jgi:hypothetical protein